MGFWSTIKSAMQHISEWDFETAEHRLEKGLSLQAPEKFKHQIRGMLPIVSGLKLFAMETRHSKNAPMYIRKMVDMLLDSPLAKHALGTS